MADVFISYKSERRAAAEHLAEILADFGYTVWWDYGLISGRDFGAQIEKELRAAKAVVVMWCSMSVESEWVREEAALAKRMNKVIPTFIEKVELPLGFSLSQTLDLSEWDGSPKSNRLDRLLRDIGQFVARAPKPNMEGLERTERAWRRFGAPPLREFALIDALERKMPPRTLPGALFSQSEREPAGEKKKLNVALFAAAGAVALVTVGYGAWRMLPREEAIAAPESAAIEGRWVGEGQDCDRYGMRLFIERDRLNVLVSGETSETSETAITGRGEDGAIETSDGTYVRRGANLVQRFPDGDEQVFEPCP